MYVVKRGLRLIVQNSTCTLRDAGVVSPHAERPIATTIAIARRRRPALIGGPSALIASGSLWRGAAVHRDRARAPSRALRPSDRSSGSPRSDRDLPSRF